MEAVINHQVLVLNKHWLAVHICTVRRAVALLYQGIAEVVADDYQTHDFDSWRDLSAYGKAHPEMMIQTPNFNLRVPMVIVLRQYNRSPPRSIKFNRRNIYMRDKHTCQYCGRKPSRDDLTIDHVIPRSRGGKTVWENVALACTACNAKKGDKLPADCGMKPRTKPRRPSWLAALRVIPAHANQTVWQRFIDSAYWNIELEE